MKIDYRTMTEGDVRSVYDLVRKADRHGFLGPPPSPPIIATHGGVLAEANGRLVGCALFTRLKTRPVVRRHYLVVAPMFRRMGIARALSERVETAAIESGAQSILSTVVEANVGMRRLLLSLGYIASPPERASKRRIIRFEKPL